MCSPYHDASLNVNHLPINSSGSTASFVSSVLTLQRIQQARLVPCKNNEKKLCLGVIAWRTENRSCAFIFVSSGLEVLSTFFKTLTTSDNLLWWRIFDFLSMIGADAKSGTNSTTIRPWNKKFKTQLHIYVLSWWRYIDCMPWPTGLVFQKSVWIWILFSYMYSKYKIIATANSSDQCLGKFHPKESTAALTALWGW